MASNDRDVHFRLTEGLAGWIDGRMQRMHGGNRHGQAQAELGMWRDTLAGELRRIRLTLGQAACVADVLNGTMLTPGIAASLGIAYAECYDAFRLAREDRSGNPLPAPLSDVSSYGAKHGPEGTDPAQWEQDLLDYLGRLGPAADMALRDAIARWWDEKREPTREGFAAVGVMIPAE
jgi:hypothetical protein